MDELIGWLAVDSELTVGCSPWFDRISAVHRRLTRQRVRLRDMSGEGEVVYGMILRGVFNGEIARGAVQLRSVVGALGTSSPPRSSGSFGRWTN